MKFRLRISSRAWAEIDRASKWWRRNRHKAPQAFDEDFDAAIEQLRTDPGIGRRIHARKRSGVRALWLDRVGYFVYYSVNGDVVEIVAVWHASRGSRPRL